MQKISISKNIKLNFSKFIEEIAALNYFRTPVVVTKGEFAVRGSIIDIYAPNHSNPIRVEFFGDEIESIRSFDVQTQRSLSAIKETEIQEYFQGAEEDQSIHIENIPKDFFSDYKEGCYLVHVDYGIAKFNGIKRLTIDKYESEYLELEFDFKDKVYVPIEKFNRVHKYSGVEINPLVSSLRDKKWEKTKARAKKSTENIAFELLTLYKKRSFETGYSFPSDNVYQIDLEKTFPFQETKDQLEAIEAVTRDMESTKPMDRLICGDVGFGKTEVAIRAAFKAAMDNKQVAVLAPTTILTLQHYQTFNERLGELGVKVELLNRMKTVNEQKNIVNRLKAGLIDIVIGTHRLLSKDIGFANLGLVVVDEEQRFGVKAKEYLKKLREKVDVLTLSATPIPRTLYMAITGVRDISLINAPPKERLPIKTIVENFNLDKIREIIQREIDRSGQVFILHNRIETISALTDKLQRLLPEIRFLTLHGQMNPKDLSNKILDFYHKKYDVLVSTTIIENGIDVPNVNTIIIDHADKYGLAQLHQLRGRVGRSIVQSYAYLMVHPETGISFDGLQRLQALKEYSALGSGYKIAVRDLEIRGAGNLLGAEQSGNIVSVGFELYCRLLNDAIAEARGERVYVDEGFELSTKCSSFIDEEYIPYSEIRISIYQRISQLKTKLAVDDLSKEIADRFGPLPRNLKTMLALIREQMKS